MFIRTGTKLKAKETSNVFDIIKGVEYTIVDVTNTFLRTKAVKVYEGGKMIPISFFELPEKIEIEDDEQVKIDHQKEVADKVLKCLSVLNPTVIVAGGAPRDWYMGKVAQDIDVYIHYDIAQPIHVIKHLRDNLGGKWDALGNIEEKKQDAYEMLPKLLRVFQGEVDGETVQVMVMAEETFRTVKQFPVSSSKVWYKTDRGVVPEREFEQEFMEQKIQIVIDEYYDEMIKPHGGRKQTYIKKIKEKFPNNVYTYLRKSDYDKFKQVERQLRNKRAKVNVNDFLNVHAVPVPIWEPVNLNQIQVEELFL